MKFQHGTRCGPPDRLAQRSAGEFRGIRVPGEIFVGHFGGGAAVQGNVRNGVFTMKRGLTIILSLLLSTFAAGAEPDVEFSGVLTADGKTKIALTNKSTGVTRWVDPGAEFNGFLVARYDARDETVTLQRAGQDFRLPMVAPKESPAPSSGATLRGNAGASPSRVPAATAASPVTTASPPPPAAVLAPEPPAPRTGTPPGAPTGATGEGAMTRSVQPGETLEIIARNAGVTVEQLKVLNPQLNAGSLQVGQVIRIR